MADVQNMKLTHLRNPIQYWSQQQGGTNLVGTFIKAKFWSKPAWSISISGHFLMHHSNIFHLEKNSFDAVKYMTGQMASSRWFRKQKAGSVSDPLEDSMCCGIPVCKVTPPQIMELTVCYVINKKN